MFQFKIYPKTSFQFTVTVPFGPLLSEVLTSEYSSKCATISSATGELVFKWKGTITVNFGAAYFFILDIVKISETVAIKLHIADSEDNDDKNVGKPYR